MRERERDRLTVYGNYNINPFYSHSPLMWLGELPQSTNVARRTPTVH